jgi:hypothetical protein
VLLLADGRLSSSPGPTLKDIELELTREEQEREQGSSVVPEADEDTMIEYLMLRLEIEGQQYVALLLSLACSFLPRLLILRQASACCRPTGQKIPHHQGTYGFRYAAHTDFPPNQEAAANAAQVLSWSPSTHRNGCRPGGARGG